MGSLEHYTRGSRSLPYILGVNRITSVLWLYHYFLSKSDVRNQDRVRSFVTATDLWSRDHTPATRHCYSSICRVKPVKLLHHANYGTRCGMSEFSANPFCHLCYNESKRYQEWETEVRPETRTQPGPQPGSDTSGFTRANQRNYNYL